MADGKSFYEIMREKMEEDRVSECFTPNEQAFLQEISDRKLQMENLVRGNIFRHPARTLYRRPGLNPRTLKPALAFKRELQEILNSHQCHAIERVNCWAFKLGKIYEEYLQFLAAYSLIIYIRESLGPSAPISHLPLFDIDAVEDED